jgi:outer membrane lipoprotein carrier protein
VNGIAAVFIVVPVLTSGAGQADDPQTLARAIQRHYESVLDFRADFVHSYQGGALRKTVTERGTVLVKKPGMMRWTYEGAERKVFVSDGQRMYSYLPEDRQVYVGTVPADDRASTPALFLAGKGNLLRDFTIAPAALPAGAPQGSVALRLVPVRPDADFEALVLAVDRESLVWRMLVTADKQGGQSTFIFTNVKENVGIPDREFTFKIPRGVDVITDAPPQP